MFTRTTIETYTGKFFDYENIRPDDICIEDIAHALANINRYTGHSKGAVSVAEHSILVSRLVPEPLRLHALLHDAHEAYVGDINTPLSFLWPGLKALKATVQKAVYEALGIPPCSNADWGIIKNADLTMLATEAYWCMKSRGEGWSLPFPMTDRVTRLYLDIYAAEEAFLGAYQRERFVLAVAGSEVKDARRTHEGPREVQS